MQQIKENLNSVEKIFHLTGYKREDFLACLGCKICASVCTLNDLDLNTNPQELLLSLFLNKDIDLKHPLLNYCTNCYQCTHACPWNIKIPEIIRAIRENCGLETLFERTFKDSINRWGRVYEPYMFFRLGRHLFKHGYLKYIKKWTGYINIHFPKKIKLNR